MRAGVLLRRRQEVRNHLAADVARSARPCAAVGNSVDCVHHLEVGEAHGEGVEFVFQDDVGGRTVREHQSDLRAVPGVVQDLLPVMVGRTQK